jgi:hypothetical protein
MTYSSPSWVAQFDGAVDAPSPYDYGSEPPAGWRPFSNTCAWNTPISSSPTASADSSSIVTWLNGLGGPVDRYMGVGGTVDDFDHPWYPALSGSPLQRVKFSPGSKDPSVSTTGIAGVTGSRLRISELHNRRIPMPVVATPAGGTDGHMAILTATHSFEMWGSGTWTPGEGRYGCRYGAIFDLRGDSLSTDGHGATAAGTSLLAGQIRLSELQAGYIPHALAMITKYTRWNVFTAPAIGAATPDPGTVAGDANDLQRPVTGSRLQLNYTAAEINALGLPAWKTTILQAMREYGMIIMDTGGVSWGLQFESGTMDTARGQTDRWRTFGAAQGWAQAGGATTPYILPLKTGVDWTRLRVLA